MARLVLDKHTVVPGDQIAYVIINDTDQPLAFGLGYGLEEQTSNGWTETPVLDVFAAVGLGVDAGGTSLEMTATVPPNLRPARYRISKRFWADLPDDLPPHAREQCISAEFTVEPTPSIVTQPS